MPPFSTGEANNICPECRAAAMARAQVEPPIISRRSLVLERMPVTAAIVGVNVLVFIAMTFSGVSPGMPEVSQLIKWGADFGPLTVTAQPWRILTSNYVHIGIVHILLNMWCLWNLGRLMEKFLGPLITIAVYLLTALGASTLSLAWNPLRASAGASGAIFGITGVLISVLYFGKLNLTPESVKSLLGYVVRFALINLVYGFVVVRIDNMAHLGGLVSGLLIGLLLAQTVSLPREERASAQAYRLVASAVCLVLLFVAVVRVRGYAAELGKGQAALEAKQYDSAIDHFQRYVAASPNDAFGHGMLGYSYHSVNKCDQASTEYQRSLALKPDVAWVQANLASIYVCQSKFNEAISLFNAALPKIRPDAQLYLCYATALNATHALTEAEAAARKSISLDSKEPRTHSLLAQILIAEDKGAEAEHETKLAESLQSAK